jgi:hypothetical protein
MCFLACYMPLFHQFIQYGCFGILSKCICSYWENYVLYVPMSDFSHVTGLLSSYSNSSHVAGICTSVLSSYSHVTGLCPTVVSNSSHVTSLCLTVLSNFSHVTGLSFLLYCLFLLLSLSSVHCVVSANNVQDAGIVGAHQCSETV